MNEWANFIAPILAVVVGSVISLIGVYLANRSNNQRLRLQLEHERKAKNQDLLRKYAEELHVLIDEFSGNIQLLYLKFKQLTSEDIPAEKAIEAIDKCTSIMSSEGAKNKFMRMTMIIRLCFMDLMTSLGELTSLQTNIMADIAEYFFRLKQGRPVNEPDAIKKMFETLSSIDRASKQLLEQITKHDFFENFP